MRRQRNDERSSSFRLIRAELGRSRGDDGRGDLAESPEPEGSNAPKVARQIETPRPPDPIMRRPCADREEKRVIHGKRHEAEEQLDPDNPNQRGLLESVLKDYCREDRRSISRIMARRMKATEVWRYCS